MNKDTELSIVIVNWNASGYLRECLSALKYYSRNLNYEVVVVDNHSTTGDLDEVAAQFPFIRLIRCKTNQGFARANNIGFRSTISPYVLFLNPDTRVVGEALRTMLQVIRQSSDAGVVGCRLLNFDETLQTSCVQRYPRILNQALNVSFLHNRLMQWMLEKLPRLRHQKWPLSVEVISGACLMVRRDVFELIGGFGEEYFMYAEDVDLCYKTAKAGWKCYYAGDATVMHYGGGSSRLKPVSNWAAVVQCGAKLQFMRKTRGAAYGYLYRLALGASASIRWTLLGIMAGIVSGSSKRDRCNLIRAKWAAILCWALRPDRTLDQLTANQA